MNFALQKEECRRNEEYRLIYDEEINTWTETCSMINENYDQTYIKNELEEVWYNITYTWHQVTLAPILWKNSFPEGYHFKIGTDKWFTDPEDKRYEELWFSITDPNIVNIILVKPNWETILVFNKTKEEWRELKTWIKMQCEVLIRERNKEEILQSAYMTIIWKSPNKQFEDQWKLSFSLGNEQNLYPRDEYYKNLIFNGILTNLLKSGNWVEISCNDWILLDFSTFKYLYDAIDQLEYIEEWYNFYTVIWNFFSLFWLNRSNIDMIFDKWIIDLIRGAEGYYLANFLESLNREDKINISFNNPWEYIDLIRVLYSDIAYTEISVEIMNYIEGKYYDYNEFKQEIERIIVDIKTGMENREKTKDLIEKYSNNTNIISVLLEIQELQTLLLWLQEYSYEKKEILLFCIEKDSSFSSIVIDLLNHNIFQKRASFQGYMLWELKNYLRKNKDNTDINKVIPLLWILQTIEETDFDRSKFNAEENYLKSKLEG